MRSAFLRSLEISTERQARVLVEAAVATDEMSRSASRERTTLLGRINMHALRLLLDERGVSLEQAMCLLLDRDVSELRE